MQKISSIHKVIQQIWGYQILIATPIFDHAHPKIIERTFSFSEFSPACKKISSSHQFILEIQSILESCDQTGHTYFHQLMIMWICINMQKIRLFHWFVLEIWLIKKSCNLTSWEYFGPYLRNKNFPKYGICAGSQQMILIFIIEQIQ